MKRMDLRKKDKKGDEASGFTGKMRVPREALEMFGLVLQRMGTNQIRVQCADGKERICRIPGKLKKKVWMKEGDIVIIRLWDFQKEKADIIWRYFGTQSERLRREGHLKGLPF